MMQVIIRQIWIAAILVLGQSVFMQQSAFAQEWPTRSVRMILTGPPGGGPDRVTRWVADSLSKMWGQAVVIENKPGASTRIGAEAVAVAKPDGYTLLSTSSTHTLVKSLFPDTKFDPLTSFSPITPFVRTDVVYIVNADSPYKTLKELIDAHKKSGRPIEYGTFGLGSAFHIFGLLIGQHASVAVLPVPYKGEALSLNDLLGKQIESSFNSVSTALPQIRAGKVRALAVVAPKRSSILPDVPTFAELGYDGLDSGGWFGLFAPAGTPPAIVNKISVDVGKILARPELAQILRAQGLEPIPSTPDAFRRQIAAEVPRWERFIREFHITPN